MNATPFNVPIRNEVSLNKLQNNLKKMLGFVPNLYAGFARSEQNRAKLFADNAGSI